MRASGNQRGIALVVVLWVGLLVAAIAGAFILDTRTSTRLTRNFLDNAQARALADGGVHIAVYELIQSDRETVWARDGRLYRRTVPGGILDIAIEDEAGKIDINNADQELLEGLFRSAGLADDQARAVVEAMETLRNGSAAGRRNAARRRISGNPGAGFGGAFRSVDSLGQVPGMTAALYARLRPAVTIYGTDNVHYLSAPREALLAIPDMPGEAVDIFLKARLGDDPTLALNDFLLQGQARDYWREDLSSFVTVKVTARSGNGAKFTRVAVVEFRQVGDPVFVIKEWREGDASSLRPPGSTGEEPPALPGGAT